MVWLGRLRELSSIVGSGLPVEESLRLVATTARELLGFDFCGVLVPNVESSALVIAGWSGLSRRYVDSVNSSSPVTLGGTAPSSRAYFSGEPVAVSDIETESGFAPWGGVALQQGYHSMISVPLRAAGRVLGTLNGYHAVPHDYSAAETERLTLLAGYAAAALRSAALVEELREANDSLLEQRDLLTRSEAIHQRLLRVSLESGGIAGVVETLAELIGRPVTMRDAGGEVLVVAGGDEGAGARSAAVSRSVMLGSEAAGTLLIGPAEDGSPGADGAGGSDGAGEYPGFDPIDARAVDHAAVVIALELLRLRTALETEYRIHGELVSDVLLFGVSEQAERRARSLGHDLAQLRLAVVAEVPGPRGRDEPRRLLSALSAVSAVRLPGNGLERVAPLVAEHQGRIVALWPDGLASEGGADPGEVAAVRVHTALRAAFAGEPVLVASSGSRRSGLADAHRVAAGAFELARASGRTDGAVSPPSLGILGVLLQVDRPDSLLEFARRQLGPVVDYDQRRGSDLLATLRTFLDSGADRTATATRLRVHPNTVQQRLRRIEALTGLELRTADDLMAFSSALAVWQVASL